MSYNWQPVTLGNLVEIKHGYAFKGDFITDEENPNLLLTPGNFAIGGGFQFKKKKFYSGEIPQEYVLNEGDVIVTMTDLSKEADTLGYAAKVPSSEYVLLHNQRLGKLVLKTDQTSLDFLHWVLRTKDYRNEILSNYTGSTVKHTSPSKISVYTFLLPPLSEQHTIAALLGALDDKIELNRKIAVKLEAMARALYRSWFVNFDPVHARSRGLIPPHMDEATAALFPDRFGEDLMPDGWEEKSLTMIATFLNGTALQKFPAADGKDALNVIKIAELRNGISPKSGRASTNIPAKYRIENGDVLFSWSGSLLQRVWTEGTGALNQHLFKVSSECVPKWFHFFAVDQHMEDFRRTAESKATTMGHIQRHHLDDAVVCAPDANVMEAADRIIAPLFERSITVQLENQTLSTLRDTLLPRLMSGELRVGEAREMTEDVV
ncbi:restriction endonuclease subunit S [Halomonas sp. KRD171]|uniref:restriction endonuclease subunit S n=1 Tax=Halomonas sp. KRD171 TaxID=2729726 RepID=UPI0019D1554D|nr:restriction endonuclease subunit S [Halomonas sp. KRD171]